MLSSEMRWVIIVFSGFLLTKEGTQLSLFGAAEAPKLQWGILWSKFDIARLYFLSLCYLGRQTLQPQSEVMGSTIIASLTQAFFIRLCAHSHKRGHLRCHLTLLLLKMDQSHATYFSQKEQVVIMENYKNMKIYIAAKSNKRGMLAQHYLLTKCTLSACCLFPTDNFTLNLKLFREYLNVILRKYI